MIAAGRESSCVLPDGRIVEYWEGGDPQGRPVVQHPGTPATRIFGRWGHEAAAAAGVRLVAVNRPGYGGSTSSAEPSLLATGRDTAAVAALLGLPDYGVLGISGGGPFAVATAVADPGAVRAVAVVAGVGPWRVLDDPTEDLEERAYLALLDAGDVAAAEAGARQFIEEEFTPMRLLDDGARVDAMLAEPESPVSNLVRDDEYRALWAANMPLVLDRVDGYVFDNLAWGGTWDIDPSDVVAPTVVWDTVEGAGARHGRWYAEHIAGSELVLFPGESHLDACDGHWPEVLAGLLRVWA
jgi:pimeloyl-ACP methyl ester carboxylesterase